MANQKDSKIGNMIADKYDLRELAVAAPRKSPVTPNCVPHSMWASFYQALISGSEWTWPDFVQDHITSCGLCQPRLALFLEEQAGSNDVRPNSSDNISEQDMPTTDMISHAANTGATEFGAKSTPMDWNDNPISDAHIEPSLRPAIHYAVSHIRHDYAYESHLERGAAVKLIFDTIYAGAMPPLADLARSWKYAAQAVVDTSDEIVEILLVSAKLDAGLVSKVMKIPLEEVLAVQCFGPRVQAR